MLVKDDAGVLSRCAADVFEGGPMPERPYEPNRGPMPWSRRPGERMSRLGAVIMVVVAIGVLVGVLLLLR